MKKCDKNIERQKSNMPTTCVIDFDNNPMKVIYAGQLLRGTVTLTLTAPKSVRGVYIRIHGKAYAHWTEGTGDNRKTYTGSENYLDEKTYLAGGNGTNGNVKKKKFFFEH